MTEVHNLNTVIHCLGLEVEGESHQNMAKQRIICDYDYNNKTVGFEQL
jgi:hypothetical protein